MLQRERRFPRNPDSFRAINIGTGEGGSNMLWCHDLFGRDCSRRSASASIQDWHGDQTCFDKAACLFHKATTHVLYV